jgi:small subunit ribosomal protein S20
MTPTRPSIPRPARFYRARPGGAKKPARALTNRAKTPMIRGFPKYPITAARRQVLANSAQSRKRARQAEKHRRQNAGYRSMFRTFIKKVLAAVEAGDKEQAQVAYQNAVEVIDKTASKGLIHKNKAARHKSRLNARVRAM